MSLSPCCRVGIIIFVGLCPCCCVCTLGGTFTFKLEACSFGDCFSVCVDGQGVCLPCHGERIDCLGVDCIRCQVCRICHDPGTFASLEELELLGGQLHLSACCSFQIFLGICNCSPGSVHLVQSAVHFVLSEACAAAALVGGVEQLLRGFDSIGNLFTGTVGELFARSPITACLDHFSHDLVCCRVN